MEMKLKGHLVVKGERRAEAIGGEGGGGIKKVSSTVIGRERSSSMESSPRPSSSNHTLPISQEEQLKSTKTEMGEVREENERLKMVLAKVAKDYQSLQMKFFDIVQQEDQKPVEAPPIPPNVEEQQLISLSLGTSASGSKKEEKEKASKSKSKSKEEDDKMEKGLSLGLDCKYQGCSSSTTNHSPENSSEEAKEEEAGEPWPPGKILKNLRNGENEVAQQAHVKKARVSVRARCDAPTMIDGCQWRKYGQKIAKGNPCPRAYYRCTVAPACPVRKQVQRCAEDMSILITTYEGTHNHPLSISATAMATTTSAAASMLISGSSTSQPAIGGGQGAATTAASAISSHCLNFGLSDWRARQLYLSNPTISSNPSYPTITLDLTAPLPSSAQQASQFNRFPSTFTSNSRYPSSSFNFSESSTAPSSWSNGYLGYGTQPYNKSHLGTLKQPQEPYNYQSYLQKATNTAPSAPSQHLLTDTIAKAITSDPSFQSALAAAITSYVGAQGTQGVGESGAGHSLKWADQHSNSAGAPCTSAPTGNGCASSYLNRTASTSSNPQQGNLMFLQTPVAFSSSKSASASPVETRENIN